MALCHSDCSIDLPGAYSNACTVHEKEGGIHRIGFIKCDYEFTDITDDSEWNTAIDNGDAVWSGLLKGSKPRGSFVKRRVDSCSPEQVIGSEKSITFEDYNSDAVDGGTGEYDFWNTILENVRSYRLVFLTCDGYLYGPIDKFTIEVDEEIGESQNDSRFIGGTIYWQSKTMEVPTYVGDLDISQSLSE